MRRFVPLFFLLAALAAGCGSSRSAAPPPATGTTTQATTTPTTTKSRPQQVSLRIYLLRDGRVAPVARLVPGTPAVGHAAVEQLLAGPTPGESLTTAIPADTTLDGLSIAAGIAAVRLSQSLPPTAEAQVVYTLMQFASVHAVAIDGGPARTRADFENKTPQILVESPLPNETVKSPVELRGTADTFEATFQADVLDANSKKIGSTTVTASSGSGQRGTYVASIPVAAPPGPIRLVVYEVSAADASHLHQVEIPLILG